MFPLRDKSRGFLFASVHILSLLQARIEALNQEVERIEANRLLNTSPADLVKYLSEKYRVEPLVLDRDGMTASEKEVKVDVSGDPRRAFFASHDVGPFYAPGQRIEVSVPFKGDEDLFYAQSSTYTGSFPQAVVNRQSLVISFDTPHDVERDLKSALDETLREVEQHIGWVNGDVRGFNNSLAQHAQAAVDGRRQRLLNNQGKLAALGIPVKQSTGMPTTYAIPDVRKKVAPTLPPASSGPFKPEPVLEMALYEHALKVMGHMTLVMERSPSAFATMDEEALRQHFLMQLNAQFEGKATGETFNVSGKTDILLREGDRNVFIAECKFWKGPKKFVEAVDQLLGYTNWRDTKAAILVFNRGTEMSTVLTGVQAAMKDHANFKRQLGWPHESGFRYVFHQPNDVSREMIISVLIFQVPSDNAA
ncbi:hypothetical protein [Roseateles sp.]|uniref:hypothetical protein n=1 Tax=Roseateles sp. TaxID=1971397 RepID=UPI0025D91F0B|nr:hypothetical protein [Roseateles sp.]MBV8035536.1 hypothetical protein [Roseateles sp.]